MTRQFCKKIFLCNLFANNQASQTFTVDRSRFFTEGTFHTMLSRSRSRSPIPVVWK